MAARPLIYLLFLLTMVSIVVLRPRHSYSAQPEQEAAPVPREAVTALREGRYLRASLILREYLGTTRDTSATAILLSAQAEAGWGDWERVESLLRGRRWLDTFADGHGWELLGRSQLELGQWAESRASFTRYLDVTTSDADRAQGLALVRRAIAQTRSESYDSAVATYQAAVAHLPQIEDWLHVFAASAAASAADTAVVDAELAEVDSAIHADWGWRARVRARQNAKRPHAALAIAEQVAGRHSSASMRADAFVRAGELRLEIGDSSGARAAFARALALAPRGEPALAAARTLVKLRQATPLDHRAIGELYLRQGNVERGQASLQVYLERGAPSAQERLELDLVLGRALFNAGRYPDAEQRLLAYAGNTRAADDAAAALYLAGRAQYRGSRRPQALATFRRVVQDYPREPAAAEAAFLLADLAHDDEDLESARSFYRQATVLAPESDDAGHARMRLAGMEYVRGDYEAALQHYHAYLSAFPRGRRAAQASYWAAKAQLELGQKTEAQRLLRQVRALDAFSYYGDRAAALLGDDFWNVALEPSPAVNERQESQVAHALARIELLREIGWTDAASFELARARRHFARWDGALYSLAEGLNQRGYTTTGIALAWDLYRRERAWNLRLLRIVYPFPYQQIILKEAAERKVDPFLAAGLIRQESMFNPRAQSGAGAIGLMQVMPNTGKVLARGLGIRTFASDMLRQPDVNIALGMTYLADQLRTYRGRLVPVLAAYNAGPTRVQRWRAFPEWKSDELLAERIPFEETRDYVKIVQHNAAMYRALYGSVVAEAGGD